MRGVYTTVSATMTLLTLGPSAAMSPIASKTSGNAIMPSMMRIMIPIQPRKVPCRQSKQPAKERHADHDREADREG